MNHRSDVDERFVEDLLASLTPTHDWMPDAAGRLAAIASAAPSLVSKLFFNSKLGEQLPYDARRDALNAQARRRKKCPRPLPRCFGGNDAGTFTIAHNRLAASLNPASMRSRHRLPSTSRHPTSQKPPDSAFGRFLIRFPH